MAADCTQLKCSFYLESCLGFTLLTKGTCLYSMVLFKGLILEALNSDRTPLELLYSKDSQMLSWTFCVSRISAEKHLKTVVSVVRGVWDRC